MLLDRPDPLTGLPLIKGEREEKRWQPLPRAISKQAEAYDATDESAPWFPAHHEFDGSIVARVRCWKCGRDLKSWRQLLQSNRVGLTKDGAPIVHADATPVLIAGQPAVAFLPLPHMTQTPVAIRWPKLNETVVFAAQHCTDCVMRPEDLPAIITCYLAGADGILWTARQHNLTSVPADAWATYLYRWGDVEPVGLRRPEEVGMAKQIVAPGQLITAAQVMLDQDRAERSGIPSGIRVRYDGLIPPPGWVKDSEAGWLTKL